DIDRDLGKQRPNARPIRLPCTDARVGAETLQLRPRDQAAQRVAHSTQSKIRITRTIEEGDLARPWREGCTYDVATEEERAAAIVRPDGMRIRGVEAPGILRRPGELGEAFPVREIIRSSNDQALLRRAAVANPPCPQSRLPGGSRCTACNLASEAHDLLD